MKWLVDRCSKSNAFAWGVAVVGVAAMVAIAFL